MKALSVSMNRQNILGLKIDVDTYVGMKQGVPRLLSILAHFGIPATFYLSMGPDASGRALLQLVKNPRFIKNECRAPLWDQDCLIWQSASLTHDCTFFPGTC
jgi:hypothetical protein